MNLVQDPIMPQGAGRGLPSLRTNVGKWCKRDLDWLESRGPTAGEKEKHTPRKKCLCGEFCFVLWEREEREKGSVEQPHGKRKKYRDSERQTQIGREQRDKGTERQSQTQRDRHREIQREAETEGRQQSPSF